MRLTIKHSTCLASVLFFVGCSSVPDGAPEEFHLAKAAVNEADKADVDDVLPQTVERAETTLDEALDLYDKSEDDDLDRAARDNILKEASAKASQAKGIADQAVGLNNQVKAWDENIEQHRNFQQMSQELQSVREQLASAQQGSAQAQAQATASQESAVPMNIRGPVAFFESGATNVTGRFTESLASLGQVLKADPKAQVKLIGYTDAHGNPAANRELATARAQSVAEILKSMGVQETQIAVDGGGIDKEASPKKPGEMQLARRVEAVISTGGPTEMTTSR